MRRCHNNSFPFSFPFMFIGFCPHGCRLACMRDSRTWYLVHVMRPLHSEAITSCKVIPMLKWVPRKKRSQEMHPIQSISIINHWSDQPTHIYIYIYLSLSLSLALVFCSHRSGLFSFFFQNCSWPLQLHLHNSHSHLAQPAGASPSSPLHTKSLAWSAPIWSFSRGW